MKKIKLFPLVAVLVALIILAITLYGNATVPNGPDSSFIPPKSETSQPAPPWGTGVEIITPIA